MLFSISSLIVLGLGILAIILPNTRAFSVQKKIAPKTHRMICAGLFAVGCFVRLYRLGTLPGGISAEEALVGVQAKALWQTGGFLFEGGLTTQFAQWTGESTGPLLATLTAPFVGLLGMTPWATRLPLALLSCAAMPAAYGVGDRLGGKPAARWCLAMYAICPYFVLTARLTAAAHAAVCLLPMAVYLLLRGMERPGYLYAGVVLMGLTSYAQNMYFFIAPAVILLACLFAVGAGIKKRHALFAAALGMLICVPAILTLWVNLNGREGFTWMGVVRIPALEDFDKADDVSAILIQGYEAEMLRRKLWAVITGSVFQVLSHLNISAEMFAPKGMGALYILSIPLMMLGVLSLIRGAARGVRYERGRTISALFVFVMGCVTVFWLFMYGSNANLERYMGYTCVYDYSAMLLFDVLMVAAGLCHMERRSVKGTGALCLLFAASFAMLCVHLFGGHYQENANTYFSGFGDLSRKASAAAEQMNTKVNVTSTVYPHVTPSDAAEMMYLYATDADMSEVVDKRAEAYEVVYTKGIEEPDSTRLHLVAPGDIGMWDLTPFQYEELDGYALLMPIGE